MFVLYVKKEWMESLPEVSEMILLELEGSYYSLLAGKAQVDGPFVRADLARREVPQEDNVFIHAMIPVSVVARRLRSDRAGSEEIRL